MIADFPSVVVDGLLMIADFPSVVVDSLFIIRHELIHVFFMIFYGFLMNFDSLLALIYFLILFEHGRPTVYHFFGQFFHNIFYGPKLTAVNCIRRSCHDTSGRHMMNLPFFIFTSNTYRSIGSDGLAGIGITPNSAAGMYCKSFGIISVMHISCN